MKVAGAAEVVRVLILSSALATTAVGLAGCETTSQAGSTGISVDGSGRPVAVLAVCRGHIDGVTIYRDRQPDDAKADDATVAIADWLASPAVNPSNAGGARLDMRSPQDPWSRDGPPPELLRQQTRYTVYGWTKDNRWNTTSVDFTPARLARLAPDQVLTQTYDAATDDFVDTVQSPRRFRTAACG